MNPKNVILQIGCGNSTLAEEVHFFSCLFKINLIKLHDNGFRNVRSIDIDEKVIKKHQNLQAIRRPTLKFDCCSANNVKLKKIL